MYDILAFKPRKIAYKWVFLLLSIGFETQIYAIDTAPGVQKKYKHLNNYCGGSLKSKVIDFSLSCK